MSDFQVRIARLDDTQAISRLFREQIETWQRINPQGHVENVAYDMLTIYERWTHGGPWMSIETGAIFLSHLLRVGIVPLVVIDDEFVLGYAEGYPGHEPDPFGVHMHITNVTTHFENAAEVRLALLRHFTNLAHEQKMRRITTSLSAYDNEAASYYSQLGWKPVQRLERFTISAQIGQGFYKAVDHTDSSADQIKSWQMSIGRHESARYQWENLWPRLWHGVPELASRKLHHLKFVASGQEALICCQQQLYDQRSAEIYCWSPRPLTPQMLTAIRDWVHRQNYRTLILDIPESSSKVLGPEAEKIPYEEDVYAFTID